MCLVIPVAFGVCVNYRWPKQSKIILKVRNSTGHFRHWALTNGCRQRPEQTDQQNTAHTQQFSLHALHFCVQSPYFLQSKACLITSVGPYIEAYDILQSVELMLQGQKSLGLRVDREHPFTHKASHGALQRRLLKAAWSGAQCLGFGWFPGRAGSSAVFQKHSWGSL